MKLNTNYLYYFNEREREYKRITNILDKYNIAYMPIKLNPNKIDAKFLELMLEACENGFDDLIKNPNKANFGTDIYELKYSEFIKMIVESPETYLRPVWFLGNSGNEAIITCKAIEDEFTKYLKYSEREMSKIYG